MQVEYYATIKQMQANYSGDLDNVQLGLSVLGLNQMANLARRLQKRLARVWCCCVLPQ